MSDATLTLFTSRYRDATREERLRAGDNILSAVALFAHDKDPSQLNPGEITVQMNDAGEGSFSKYTAELRLTIDQEDYPFDFSRETFERNEFDPEAAQQACRELAERLWWELKDVFGDHFLVWVMAGPATGYFDNGYYDNGYSGAGKSA